MRIFWKRSSYTPGKGQYFGGCLHYRAQRPTREERTSDQHDAYSISAWLSRADQDGSLATFLNPSLTPPERTIARVEGWILGVLT